jgi:hypothetical protein
MVAKLFTIFLSGTRRDLAAFYPPVKAALEAAFPGYEIRMMEDAEPEDIPGDHWSRREATTPDLLIGLVGQYYGSVPRGQDRSLTEQEFDVAGQVSIDRLMFVTEAGDPAVVETQNEVAKERIRSFRGKIDATVTRRAVATPEEFAREALKAVQVWERETLHGATQRPDAFFGPLLTSGALFDHTESLVGQADALAQLQAFIASDRRVFILHAPWGRGKSRLLLELGRSSGANVRFARTGAPLLRERLRISAADPCVIVIEDVWRHEDDLAAFLDFLSRCDRSVKLITTTRSIREKQLQAVLREGGLPAKDVDVLALPSLADREQQQLVGQILGTTGEIVYRLAVRTRGSALAGVVAARLIRRGFVTLAELEQSPDFIGEVLDRFQHALFRSAGENVETENRLKKTLQTVALCAPVRPANSVEAEGLAAFLQLPPEDVIRDLGQLEQAGLLFRRGGLVTIPVDAIRENQALRACVTPAGELTGFADRALRELGDVFRRNLLRNLALVDWQASQETEGTSLLAKVWPELGSAYQVLPPSIRLSVLKDLEDVAPYQAGPALAFARHALANGLGPPETHPFYAGRFQVTLSHLHDALTDIVRGTLHDPSSFAGAADILWEMAQNDTRPANSHPRSAERVLRELGELRPNRPVAWYEQVLQWIEQKVDSGAIPGFRLAEYLSPFAEKEIVHWWHDNEAMHLTTFPLPMEQVRPLRVKAFRLLERIAHSKDLGAAGGAIRVLGKGLEPPAGIGGRQVTDEELAKWEEEELETLTQLRSISERHRLPVIDLCVLREVAPIVEYASSVVVRNAAGVLATELHSRVSGTIERALVPWWSFGQYNDEEADQKQLKEIETTVDAHVRADVSVQELVSRIAIAHENLQAVNYESRPDQLVFLLTRKSQAFAGAIIEALLADNHPLASSIGAVILGLLESDPENSKKLLDRGAREGGTRVKLAIASACRHEALSERIGQEPVLRYLALLLSDAGAVVQQETLRTIWLAKQLDGRKRAGLLLTWKPLLMPVVGEWATAVAPQALYAHFLPEERERLATKLQGAERLDFHCFELLSQLCADVPAAVVDMLVARVNACATADEDFEPLDEYAGHDYFAQLPASERERGLVALGELLGSDHWRVRLEAQQLFAKMAAGDQAVRRRVRLAWVASGESDLIRRAAETFRFESPQTLFAESETVVAVARAAAAVGPEVVEKVTTELVGASLSGVRMSSRGEAAPLDVFIRDEARRLSQTYPAGSPGAAVYDAISRAAAESISHTLRRNAEEDLLP